MSEPLRLPQTSAVWQWIVTSRRALLGWGLALLGAVALFLGWYGVSGNALTAKQLPYVVSGGLVGVALVVLAAAVLATDDIRRQLARVRQMESKVTVLYDLLIEGDPAMAEEPTSADVRTDALVAVPGGTSFHRSTCGLVAGKAEARRVTPRAISERGLKPCRICDPATVTAG